MEGVDKMNPTVESEGESRTGPPVGPRDPAPDFTLPDWQGREFRLSSLRGRRVLVVAWASW